MVAASSSSYFFSADWYSPMDMIRNLYQDPQASEQCRTGSSQRDPPSPSCCVTRMDAHMETVVVEQVPPEEMGAAWRSRASTRRVEADSFEINCRTAEVLTESVAEELQGEEDFLECLPEGPACTNLSEEKTLQQKVKQTLLDGAASGGLLLALADLGQPRNCSKLNDSETTPNTGSPNDSESETSWEKLGLSLAAASERLDLRDESSDFLAVETETTVQQPKATPDIEDAPSERVGQLVRKVAPFRHSPAVLKDQKLSKARDALTKSKRPEVTDFEQLDLQAKTALLDASMYGCLHAKMMASPMKGKRMASPKKGGS